MILDSSKSEMSFVTAIVSPLYLRSKTLYYEAVKVLSKASRKSSIVYLALSQILAICRADNKLSGIHPEERAHHRQLTVKPLVGAYFTRVKQNLLKVPLKSKTANRFTYSIHQESYLLYC